MLVGFFFMPEIFYIQDIFRKRKKFRLVIGIFGKKQFL